MQSKQVRWCAHSGAPAARFLRTCPSIRAGRDLWQIQVGKRVSCASNLGGEAREVKSRDMVVKWVYEDTRDICQKCEFGRYAELDLE